MSIDFIISSLYWFHLFEVLMNYYWKVSRFVISIIAKTSGNGVLYPSHTICWLLQTFQIFSFPPSQMHNTSFLRSMRPQWRVSHLSYNMLQPLTNMNFSSWLVWFVFFIDWSSLKTAWLLSGLVLKELHFRGTSNKQLILFEGSTLLHSMVLKDQPMYSLFSFVLSSLWFNCALAMIFIIFLNPCVVIWFRVRIFISSLFNWLITQWHCLKLELFPLLTVRHQVVIFLVLYFWIDFSFRLSKYNFNSCGWFL
jgi:hypothetical protein